MPGIGKASKKGIKIVSGLYGPLEDRLSKARHEDGGHAEAYRKLFDFQIVHTSANPFYRLKPCGAGDSTFGWR